MLYIAGVAVALTAGCGWRKQHLRADHGQSYDAAFSAQRARSERTPAAVVSGLDSQEAAIISDSYRASLAPRDRKVEEPPVVLVAPPSRERPPVLAPSVPKER
jgi:hypothetical protein